MRVGIDIDGVVHDFVGAYRRFCWSHLSMTPLETPEPTRWDFFEEWGIERELFHKHLTDYAGHIFTGDLIPGAAEGIAKLQADGHTIVYVTHRPKNAWTITKTWLHHHGLLGPHDELHFVEDKTTVPADIFLEDSVANHAALCAKGVRCYLFDQPWNRPYVGRRVYSWGEFVGLADAVALANAYANAFAHEAQIMAAQEKPMPRTPEQNEVLGTFLDLLAGPTGDGGVKRAAGLKPSWKVDSSHMAAAYRHLDPSRERYDEDSGSHKLVHAAWRLLAVAYQEMVEDGRLFDDGYEPRLDKCVREDPDE